ncbi:MAG: metallophosphoesterase family protein [Proteobacteria bacterium]|nr:metallophosphoesterase family protein [Pseudomonadota bacterium]
MKIAVLADIHGNYPALQAVAEHVERWRPDRVVVAGDIVNRGPSPVDCLEYIQERQRSQGWRVVRGNHEDYVIGFADPENSFSPIDYEIFRCSHWTHQQLGDDLPWLKGMPDRVDLEEPDIPSVSVVHASPAGISNGVFPFTTDDQLRRKIRTDTKPPPALLCVAHTHYPLMRRIDETLVVNVGAVGLPFDRDHRAAYGQLSWNGSRWSAGIVRLEYDREQAERNFFDTGFYEGAGPMAALILDELRTARSRLYQWTMEYQARTVAGEISVDESVQRFLKKIKAS